MNGYTLKEAKLKIRTDIESFEQSFQTILNECPFYNFHDKLLLSVCKRAVDVLDTIGYAVRKYNFNTLYPLLRLQIDSCLVLQAALLHKDNGAFFCHLGETEFQLNQYNFPGTGIRMTERKVAAKIDEEFEGFLAHYKYCCDFVHFTGQSFSLPMRNVEYFTFLVSSEVGNREIRFRLQFYLPNLFEVNRTLLSLINKCRIEFVPYKDKEK